MKYFSMFSGIGGFELGIEQAYEVRLQKLCNKNEGVCEPATKIRGAKRQCKQCTQFSMEGLSCIGYSEIDKYAIQVYEQHFPNHKNYGDATKIVASSLPDFDLLVGGFPCQAFSIAGKRKGFDDTRGTLFFDVARIIKEKQPPLVLLENVKGLLSHEGGDTFRTILKTLDELGYDAEWQVLNSKNHGVPQNRERVFIVGHLRGTPRPQVFPFGETNEVHPQSDAQRNDTAHTLNCSDKHRRSYIVHNVYGGFKEKAVREFHDIAPTIRTPKGGGHIPNVVERPYITHENKSKNVSVNNHAKALRSGASANYQTVNAIRRLTPLECERLMGFPDGWTDGVSDTQRYKMCGNGVVVNVVRAIAERLIK